MYAATVLIVEDNLNLTRLCVKALSGAGYDVRVAESIQDARAQMSAQVFDVILCDEYVGQEYGLKLLRDCYAQLAADATQVIVMSQNPGIRSVCDDLDFRFFLSSPLSLRHLVTLVDRCTDRDGMAMAG